LGASNVDIFCCKNAAGDGDWQVKAFTAPTGDCELIENRDI